MPSVDLYQTLDVDPTASQVEIKRAYRRLVKLFHPDSHHDLANHDRIAQVNFAYTVLKDPQQRQVYDQTRRADLAMENAHGSGKAKGHRRQQQGRHHQSHAQAARDADLHLQQWLKQVYRPVNRCLAQILNPLEAELVELAADPFDDGLMETFQAYLADCRDDLEAARATFQSLPNPANLAGVAAQLYYCLNHVEDGLDELERFTLCYDDGYLNTGRELFRLSVKLRYEMQDAMGALL